VRARARARKRERESERENKYIKMNAFPVLDIAAKNGSSLCNIF
jgi:hypothetical protein